VNLSSVKTTNLSKSYGNFYVINKVSIQLPKNGIFGILGRNGAGKTTLLAMLMGLITPTRGDIYIFGKSLKKKKYEILKDINFQSPYVELPKKMTVHQNLFFYARLYNVKNYKFEIDRISSDLKIENLLQKNYGSLSSGQKTKVNLCKALLNKPRLLLLDEPTASLDVSTSEFIRNYISNFQKENNSTIVITSHDLVEIETMCSYLVVLNKGSISFKGDLKTLIKKNNYSSLKEFFLKND
jgi:ABC-2 type transport system ATP-binding protein